MSDISVIKTLVSKDDVILVRKSFVQMCGGSIQAAMMLSQLLYWTDGKTKIPGNWIAKTSMEWREELCFATDYEVKAARTVLEKLELVETKVKKFNGNPTVHYKLDTEKFLLLLNSTNGFGENHQNDVASSTKTITETTTETTTDIQTNTETDKKPPFPIDLPLDWKIAAGQEITEVDLDKEKKRQMMDFANLLATGFGAVDYHTAYGIAYVFQESRNIALPISKVKGQRKAVRDMMGMHVLPNHVQSAVEKLLKANMGCSDLFSVSKTAIDLANPPKDSAGAMSFLEIGE